MKPVRDPNRPKVPELAALVRELYVTPLCGSGCCWHTVFDDGNTKQRDIELAAAQVDPTHPICVRIAELALQMTPTQVSKAGRIGRVLATPRTIDSGPLDGSG